MFDDSVRVNNPYETVDQMRVAFLKKEIAWDGAWEYLCRFFNYKPAEAKKVVDSWAGLA
ncbi:MAG: hypothetical protein FWH12_06340 [Treponema sp.]|nr:hypothetical protein [Treponema sp.]